VYAPEKLQNRFSCNKCLVQTTASMLKIEGQLRGGRQHDTILDVVPFGSTIG
jgi:hypothetical protein